MTDVSTTCAEAIFRVKWKNEGETSVSNEVETLVTNNSPSQESNHPDDLFQSRYNVTPGFKPFSYFVIIGSSSHPLLLTEHAATGLVEAPLK